MLTRVLSNWWQILTRIFFLVRAKESGFYFLRVDYLLLRFRLIFGITDLGLQTRPRMKFVFYLLPINQFFLKLFQHFLRYLLYQDLILWSEYNKFIRRWVLVQLVLCLDVAIHFFPDSYRNSNSNHVPGRFIGTLVQVEPFFTKVVKICLYLCYITDAFYRWLSHRNKFNLKALVYPWVYWFTNFSKCFEYFFFIVFWQVIS